MSEENAVSLKLLPFWAVEPQIMLRSNNHCFSCLRPSHFVKECNSLYYCKRCQRPYHILLHVGSKVDNLTGTTGSIIPATTSMHSPSKLPITSSHHLSFEIKSDLLLMACQVIMEPPQGSVKAHALLDSVSLLSFVPERIAQSLHLRHQSENAKICGIAGLTHDNSVQDVTSFNICSMYSPSRFDVDAIIIPHVTCNLPVVPIVWSDGWDNLNDLQLATPNSANLGEWMFYWVRRFSSMWYIMAGRREAMTH